MDNIAANNVAYDALQNGTAAAPAQNASTTLADVIGASVPAVEQQPTPDGTYSNDQPANGIQEPGYVGKRIQQARKTWDAEHQAEITRLTERTNALMDRVIQREAQDLVNTGEFKSFDRAVEYLRLKEGVPAPVESPAQTQTPPRDANGRFVSPQNQQQGLEQRAQELAAQADFLKYSTGVDVMAIFNSNPEAKQLVLSGGNFGDVLRVYGPGANNQRQAAPALNRYPNGNGLGEVSIQGMTDEQFTRLNAALAKGQVINMR